MKRISPLIVAILLSGCITYSLVKPGKIEIGNAFRVQPTFEWARMETGNVETWTINGGALEAVQFVKGVKDGDPPFQSIAPADASKLRKFRKGMNPLEVQDLIISNLKGIGAEKVLVENQTPAMIKGAEAFRTELSYTLKDGLARKSIIIAAVKNEKLYVALYYGVKLHYFGRYKDDVEHLFTTMEVL